MDATFMHMKFQLAIVVWFQLDCCTSLALNTGTISEMPRKIEINAKTAMDSHRWIVCNIRCNQYYMLKKKRRRGVPPSRVMGMIFPFFAKQQYYGEHALGVRVTVGESH